MKQKEPRGLLAKNVLSFQHFHPDRQISYKNNLKFLLHTNISISQLFKGMFVGFLQKDSIVTEYGNKNKYLFNMLHYDTLTHFYTGCNRRNGPDFGRVFLRSNYTDITQNTYIQSSMVTEILAGEV